MAGFHSRLLGEWGLWLGGSMEETVVEAVPVLD